MIYEIAHWVQNRCPWIWEGIEKVNAALLSVKFGSRRKLQALLKGNIRLADINDAGRLTDFFARQPQESFRWFRPHEFDEETLRKLLTRRSYIIFVEETDGELVGYAFLRCFINGKCFLGKMVDANHQGSGVCTRLCAAGMDMADALGLRMFESINKENIGSMKASQKACDVSVVEELDGGDVLIEDRKKQVVG